MARPLAAIFLALLAAAVHATPVRKKIGGRSTMLKTVIGAPDISWHNGWMMGDADIIIIWYGGWSTSGGVNTPSTVSTLMKYLPQSSWFTVNRYYGQGGMVKLNTTQKVTLHSSYAIPNPSQKFITEQDVPILVKSLIQQKKVPWVPVTGVYMLMVGTGITYHEMCTMYCGWHDVFTHTTAGKSHQVPFGVVGNVAKCYPICSIYNNATDRSAPNHPEIDGTASIFAHEVVEAITNPGIGGWYDSNGEENADKCAWRFGATVKKGTRRDGSTYSYNTLMGGQPFMLQSNWDVRMDPKTKKQRGCASAP